MYSPSDTSSLYSSRLNPTDTLWPGNNTSWYEFRSLLECAFGEHIVMNLSCELLYKSMPPRWMAVVGIMSEDGVLTLTKNNHNSRFSRKSKLLNRISLVYSTVTGHLSTSTVQIHGISSSIVLRFLPDGFSRACACLFTFSQLRPAGIRNKLWFPPPGKILCPQTQPILLSMMVRAYFTPNNPHASDHWMPCWAFLTGNGEFRLIGKSQEVVYSLQIQKILGSRIHWVDPSLLDSSSVLLLIPDLGGPKTVYIKFSDRYDLEAWGSTLRALSLQPVASPLTHHPADSVRWYHTLTVKIGEFDSLKSASGEKNNAGFSSFATYLEICFMDWVFARTCIRYGAGSCNESFTFPGLAVPFPMKLNLRRVSTESGSPSEINDGIVGSVVLSKPAVSFTSQIGQWEWHTLKPSSHRVNVFVQYNEIPVLDSIYYTRISAWISDFSVSTKLVSYNSASIFSLFPIFDQIYRAQGRQLEWILYMISAEIPNMVSTGTPLFRGTSILTKAIESLFHQYGTSVLDHTVGRFIRRLVRFCPTPLELDPAKINDDDGVLTRNTAHMKIWLQLLWGFIRNETLPPVCLMILRRLKREFESMQLTGDTLVNALFQTLSVLIFLRFFVAALLNPHHYAALNSAHRRTLVLVAKIMQAFANRIKFGSKEQWLIPMNSFIEENQNDLVQWYESMLPSMSTVCACTGTRGSGDPNDPANMADNKTVEITAGTWNANDTGATNGTNPADTSTLLYYENTDTRVDYGLIEGIDKISDDNSKWYESDPGISSSEYCDPASSTSNTLSERSVNNKKFCGGIDCATENFISNEKFSKSDSSFLSAREYFFPTGNHITISSPLETVLNTLNYALERPPRQVPFNAFMGMQLATPNLIDEPAVNSQFVNYIADVFESSLSDAILGEISRNASISDIMKECKRVVCRQRVVIAALEEPDKDYQLPPKIYFNPETLLFGIDAELLEPYW